MSHANLIGTNPSETNLSGAIQNTANLIEALGVTHEQMAVAESLEGATMPNGQKYDDWLKSRGENNGS